MEKYIKADTVLKFINSCLEHEDKITDIEKAVLTGVKTCVERISAAAVITWAELKGRMVDTFKSRLAAGYIPTWNDAMKVVEELSPNGGHNNG